MHVAVFGATGSLGHECVKQSLESGHKVSVLARAPEKLPEAWLSRVRVVEGDALEEANVEAALSEGVEAVLFAIGVDRHSPEDLCTTVTRHLIATMPRMGVHRLVWCGGGSTLVPEDRVTIGARFVELFARVFMGLRHRDKAHQWDLLRRHREIDWVGVRPLQMRRGAKRADYRLGFEAFSGFSHISFADCAHAMLGMLESDTWLHKAPVIQY
ncbi:MAG: NAD(P)H-binding protein [Myxococcota bacterium]